jgi:hypothetical protein
MKSRHEWFEHELHEHRKEWVCPAACGTILKSEAEFLHHVETKHKDLFSKGSISTLSKACERQVTASSSASCPFCEAQLESRRQIKTHIGRHQADLALAVLLNPDLEDESDGEASTNSQESIDDEETIPSSRKDGLAVVIDDSGKEFLMQALVDTGSEVSMMSAAFLQKLQAQKTPIDPPTGVHISDGSVMELENKVVLKWHMPGSSSRTHYATEFYVAESPGPFDVVFGRDSLSSPLSGQDESPLTAFIDKAKDMESSTVPTHPIHPKAAFFMPKNLLRAEQLQIGAWISDPADPQSQILDPVLPPDIHTVDATDYFGKHSSESFDMSISRLFNVMSSHEFHLSIPILERTNISSPVAYVDRCVKNSDKLRKMIAPTKAFLRRFKRVYIITGLMVARNVKRSVKRSRAQIKVGLGAGVATVAVPPFGVSLAATSNSTSEHEDSGEGSFIVGFQVCSVRPSNAREFRVDPIGSVSGLTKLDPVPL